jgi:ABC-2 type transport system permease protein
VSAMGAALVVVGQPAGLDLPVSRIAAAMLHLGLLGAVFGTLARAVPAVAAVLAYLINGLAPLVDWLEPFRELSPFAQYSGHTPLAHGVSVAAAAVSVGTVLVLTALAVATFRRRDVAS